MKDSKPQRPNYDMKKWSVEQREVICDTSVFSVQRHIAKVPESDKKGVFYTLDAPDWVNVMALNEKKEIILVKQYRHGIAEISLEIPAGVVDKEHENPQDAAKTELLEETGYVSNKWTYLGSVTTNPALFTNRCHLYLAEECMWRCDQKLDTFERIEIVLMPLKSFLREVSQGGIHNALVTATVGKYLLRKNASIG